MIYLFTDFGVTGPYMGQMRAHIQANAPDETIVDLMVDVPAFNITTAAGLLAGLVENMPAGGVYVCVVDPGVGSNRKPICIHTQGRWFVGPDNGLFSTLMQVDTAAVVYEITWRPEKLSRSFHGRDLFGPVAARIAQGHTQDIQPIARTELILLPLTKQKPHISYIDVYGNCWTTLRKNDVTTDQTFSLNGLMVSYGRVFADTAVGETFWYYNSSGFVEFAINQGNCADLNKVKLGDKVLINQGIDAHN
ncbi:SAM-dependent chlorinase/fluorinase [Terasakiella sp. A23]|uniref:SAM hydrolase/SAM-dependent halogenase family protein n=1 Tax=Terasakiella sp. FCG-A23 TaxID=3080561 RepID=UPI002953E4CF|nr:SAM-dependent chlorinase/fluorinase [Terasakiella sp. A23]MDV7338737.1 SAM-dependent chlorinase/fluorinase [Terasakiella sp. A23]